MHKSRSAEYCIYTVFLGTGWLGSDSALAGCISWSARVSITSCRESVLLSCVAFCRSRLQVDGVAVQSGILVKRAFVPASCFALW